jgi:uncharacterized protein (DUF1499 family)
MTEPPPPRRRKLAAAAAVLLLLAAALVVGLGGCSGTRPTNLGVTNGKLAPCKPTPNCVSSQAPASDAEHHVEPLTYQGPRAEALARLLAILTDWTRMEVIEQSDHYLRAEATSFLFRFVDDLELYLPEDEAVIHVRSASRLGYSDLGANRDRVEELRRKFEGGGGD